LEKDGDILSIDGLKWQRILWGEKNGIIKMKGDTIKWKS
jgi:hypothetical protein